MGQYYKAVSLDKKEWMLAHDYDSGLKLMEHSYLKNHFMQTVENNLLPGGIWYKTRIVWSGDYAEDIHLVENISLALDLYIKNGHNRKEINIYQLCIDEETFVLSEFERFAMVKIMPKEVKVPSEFKYIVNYDKKMFIDKTKVKKFGDGYQIHPLSLMTCQGNGNGGGDYHTKGCGEEAIVGSWAGDHIGIEKIKPKEFEEFVFDLIE